MTRNLTALAKSWLIVLTEDYGQAIAAAKDLRIPPEWLKRLIRLRDRHCREFGCTVPADQCEIDHTIRLGRRRQNSPENLGSPPANPATKLNITAAAPSPKTTTARLHFTTRSGHTHTTTPDENWAITYPTADDASRQHNQPGNKQRRTAC